MRRNKVACRYLKNKRATLPPLSRGKRFIDTVQRPRIEHVLLFHVEGRRRLIFIRSPLRRKRRGRQQGDKSIQPRWGEEEGGGTKNPGTKEFPLRRTNKFGYKADARNIKGEHVCVRVNVRAEKEDEKQREERIHGESC